MLSDENRMIAPGRLFAVVGGRGGRETFFDEIGGVFENGFQTFPVEIFRLFSVKPYLAAKLRVLQIIQNFLRVFHRIRMRQPEFSARYSAKL